MSEKIVWWSSRFGASRKTMPVVLVRSSDGFVYVRGLLGKWKHRTFSVVSSEITTYPAERLIFPGGKAYIKTSPDMAALGKLRKTCAKLELGKLSPKALRAKCDRILKSIDAIAKNIASSDSTTANDLSFEYYGESVERINYYLHGHNPDSIRHSFASMIMAIDVLRGAEERRMKRAESGGSSGSPRRRGRRPARHTSHVNRSHPKKRARKAPHQVRGSKAAKAWGRKMRALRKRKSSKRSKR